MRVLTGVGLMVIAILSTQDVFAEKPQVCREGFNSASFDQGYSQGKNLISSLFQALGSDELQRCQRGDYFASQVTRNIERLTLPKNATNFVKCRHSGLIHGVYAQLKTISNICGFTCAYNGRLIGELSAKFYCDFANTFDGLPPDSNWVPRNVFPTCDWNTDEDSVCPKKLDAGPVVSDSIPFPSDSYVVPPKNDSQPHQGDSTVDSRPVPHDDDDGCTIGELSNGPIDNRCFCFWFLLGGLLYLGRILRRG
jgi:hypothetical protein